MRADGVARLPPRNAALEDVGQAIRLAANAETPDLGVPYGHARLEPIHDRLCDFLLSHLVSLRVIATARRETGGGGVQPGAT